MLNTQQLELVYWFFLNNLISIDLPNEPIQSFSDFPPKFAQLLNIFTIKTFIYVLAPHHPNWN